MAEMHKLTARQIETAPSPSRLADGAGLYLVTNRSGGRSWAFMYKSGVTSSGKPRRREMGLGVAGPSGLSLAQARQQAAQAREIVAMGGDPLDQRKANRQATQAAATTFGVFADQFVADQRDGWSNPKHAAQWSMTLGDAYCKPIRSKTLDDIGVDEVLNVLRPIWQDKPETARRIRMRLERVLDAARVRGLRTGENPARWRGNLEILLPRQTKKAGHHAALPWADVPNFYARLLEQEGIAALALRLTIITAARTGEIIGARWDEIDRDDAVWSIPADRMKARRDHRVPLSPEAVSVLGQLEGLSETWVFPTKRDTGPISNMSMLTLLRRMKVVGATPHGFRSSFRDWVAEATSFPGEVAEMALAHVIGNKTEAAYRRGDLFERRRALMDAWAGFVTGDHGENVIELQAERR